MLIDVWQEFVETKIPKLEWVPINQSEPKLKLS